MTEIKKDIPIQGGFYNINGVKCQVREIAKYLESDEYLIVYQLLEGDFEVIADNIDSFNSKCKLSEGIAENERKFIKQIPKAVLHFLDAKDCESRLNALYECKDIYTEDMLENFSIVLDMQLTGNTLDEKFESIKKQLILLKSFEGSRLR
jgi:hypothetical protein